MNRLLIAIVLTATCIGYQHSASAQMNFGDVDISRPKTYFREMHLQGPIVSDPIPRLDISQGATIEFQVQRTWEKTLAPEKVTVVSRGVEIKTDDKNSKYYACRFAIHMNESDLFIQVGKEIKTVNLFDSTDSAEQFVNLRKPIHVFVTFHPAQDDELNIGTYVYSSETGVLRPRSKVTVKVPTEPKGKLRVGAYYTEEGKKPILPFEGLIGGVRFWGTPFSFEALKDLLRYGQQHVERTIQPRRIDRTGELRVARFNDLVAYSDFQGDPSAGAAHRIQIVRPLAGNWVNVHNRLPKPDGPPVAGMTRAYGNFTNVDIFTAVPLGIHHQGIYRDGVLVGYLVQANDGTTKFTPQNGNTIHEVTIDGDKIRVAPAPDDLLGGSAGDVVELCRPEPLLKGDNDPNDATNSFERSYLVKYFTANCRAFNIAAMNPEIYYEDSSTGTQQPIFAYPGKGDYRNTPNTKFKAVPNFFHLVSLNETAIARESTLLTTVDEYAAMYSLRIGASIGVPGQPGAASLCNFSANAAFNKQTQNTVSKSGMSVFTEGHVRTYALVMDKAHIKLNPEFIKDCKLLLDKQRDQSAWDSMIAKWGTHYPYAVTYGGLISYEHEMNEENFRNMTSYGIDVETASSMSVPGMVEASRNVGFGTEQTEVFEKNTRSESSKVRVIGENKSLSTNPDNLFASFEEPVPIFMDLRPMYELLSPTYFDDPRVYHGLRQEMKKRHDHYQKLMAAKRERGEPVTAVAEAKTRVSETFEIVATTLSTGNSYEDPEYSGALDLTAEIRVPKMEGGKPQRDSSGAIVYEWIKYQEKSDTPMTYPQKLWEAVADPKDGQLGPFEMEDNQKDKALDSRWKIPKKYRVNLPVMDPAKREDTVRYGNPDQFRLVLSFDASELDTSYNDEFNGKKWVILSKKPSELPEEDGQESPWAVAKENYKKAGYQDVFWFNYDKQSKALEIKSEESYQGDFESLTIKIEFSKRSTEDPWVSKLREGLTTYQDRILAQEPKLGDLPGNIQLQRFVKTKLPPRKGGSDRDIVAPDSLISYYSFDTDTADKSGRGSGAMRIDRAFTKGFVSFSEGAISCKPFKPLTYSRSVLSQPWLDSLSFTVAFDVKPASHSNTLFVGGTGDNWLRLTTDAKGVPSLELTGIKQTFNRPLGETALPLNEWTRIVFAYDSFNRRVYGYYGSKQIDLTLPNHFQLAWETHEGGKRIGLTSSRGSDACFALNEFNGAIDEILVYGSPLEISDIVKLMGRKRIDPNASAIADIRSWQPKWSGPIKPAAYAGSLDTITVGTKYEEVHWLPGVRLRYCPEDLVKRGYKASEHKSFMVEKKFVAIYFRNATGALNRFRDGVEGLSTEDQVYLRKAGASALAECERILAEQPRVTLVFEDHNLAPAAAKGKVVKGVANPDQLYGRTFLTAHHYEEKGSVYLGSDLIKLNKEGKLEIEDRGDWLKALRYGNKKFQQTYTKTSLIQWRFGDKPDEEENLAVKFVKPFKVNVIRTSWNQID
jgi:hypothetical protein